MTKVQATAEWIDYEVPIIYTTHRQDVDWETRWGRYVTDLYHTDKITYNQWQRWHYPEVETMRKIRMIMIAEAREVTKL